MNVYGSILSIKVQSLGEKAGLIILLCGISHECV